MWEEKDLIAADIEAAMEGTGEVPSSPFSKQVSMAFYPMMHGFGSLPSRLTWHYYHIIVIQNRALASLVKCDDHRKG